VDRAVRFRFGCPYVAAAAAVEPYPDLCNESAQPRFPTEMVTRGDRGMKPGKGLGEWNPASIKAQHAR